jgi:hypothetical protein
MATPTAQQQLIAAANQLAEKNESALRLGIALAATQAGRALTSPLAALALTHPQEAQRVADLTLRKELTEAQLEEAYKLIDEQAELAMKGKP